MIKHVGTLSELKIELDKYNPAETNFVSYIWTEYGFYPIFMNELFSDFFLHSGRFVGTCLPGQEIFYENLVDDLYILDNFIDTSKAYFNNQETDLLIQNFSIYHDRGIAFWYTIKNFDEDEYEFLINSYNFKNLIHPIGKTRAWDVGMFNLNSFKYASGERDLYTTENTKWRTTGTLGWNLDSWKKFDFQKEIQLEEEYFTMFVKNSWKSRKYHSNNITDFIVGELGTSGTGGYGYLSPDLVTNICNFFISQNKKLFVINDLSRYPLPKNELIIEIDMTGFLDVKKMLSTINFSKCFITPSTSPLDLATYYCDTNIVLIDDLQNKNSFVSKILEINNKKSFCLSNNNFIEFEKFIDSL
jgi:hypothetical protein